MSAVTTPAERIFIGGARATIDDLLSDLSATENEAVFSESYYDDLLDEAILLLSRPVVYDFTRNPDDFTRNLGGTAVTSWTACQR